MRDGGFDLPDWGAGDSPGLPVIPLLHAGSPASLSLMDLAHDRLQALLACGYRHHGTRALAVGDAVTWRWLKRTGNPYRHEIAAVRARLGGRPGAVMLNMSYEWSCTAGVAPDPTGIGSRLLRTLDWPMPGLGRNAVVSRQEGAAGSYYAVTWPGYVGVMTAMAPGRFSAAINQPPSRRYTGVLAVDWAVERIQWWRRGGLPPSHLLRLVFDTCTTYGEALRLLRETPVCLPAFFSLSGLKAEEGAIVERSEGAAHVHSAPACIANHWLALRVPGRDRGNDSAGRLAAMQCIAGAAGKPFAWLTPPILNATTRLAVEANAARSALRVQGWEARGPATAVFTLPWAAAGDPAARDALPRAMRRGAARRGR